MTQSAIRVSGVTKIFGTRTVLDAINLEVRHGETLVILGGSGSGKSTLLRLMIGNERYNGGEIYIRNFNGENGNGGAGPEAPEKTLHAMSSDELDDYRKSIGVLFQSGALFNSMTVADNVALP